MRWLFMLTLFISAFGLNSASAQMAADKDAMYLATLKAVTDYKINDEENLAGVNRLRQNQRFNQQLVQMLEKLDNSRTKDSRNRRILKILEKAGKDIYDELK